MIDIETIRNDRAALQDRWRAEGYYGGKNLSDALVEGVRQHPHVESIYYRAQASEVWSNERLFNNGLQLAAALASLGVQKGHVVAVQLPTWVEATLIYQALAHIGAITLPIVSIYGETEVSYIVRQSRAKYLFIPGQWRGRDYAEEYRNLVGATELQEVIAVGGDQDEPCGCWTQMRSADSRMASPGNSDPNDICCLIYTSGTTSKPKGVQHTHNGMLWEWQRPMFANRGRYLSNMPAGHITGYGFMMRPLLLGAPQVFMDQWDPRLAARLIEKHRIECGGGTPMFLTTLLEAASEVGADISSLTSFNMGGQSISPDQVRLADERGFCGARIYGSTEHPTVTTIDPEAPFEFRAYTDGKVDCGNEVRIVDDQDRDVAPGEEGNILTRGPDLFAGYYDEQQDREAFAPGGWYRTGDIGKLDPPGYLCITDRKKDIIIRGGENISSVEVETCLLNIPGVKDAAVVAVPDPIYTEKVCACLVLEHGCTITLDDIRTHFKKERIAVQKTPERLEVIAELPRNTMGKVLKSKLRACVSQQQE